MVGAKRTGLAAMLSLALALALAIGMTAPRAQTMLPGAQAAVPDVPTVVTPSGAAEPVAPAIEYAPVPAAPTLAPPAIEYAPGPPAPEPVLRPAVPPGSATDANHFDKPTTILKKAGEVVEDLAKGDVKALREGPLLIHGNYCGIGNKPGVPPVDVLDAACMRHDACTTTGAIPSCACNERLQTEATAIAADPSRPEELRALATAAAASMAVLICK